MGLDMDVLAVPAEDAIDSFHFRGENLLGEVEPEHLEENGIILFHYWSKDYPVYSWMMWMAGKKGLSNADDLDDGFMRLDIVDIKRLRMDILMNNIFMDKTKASNGFNQREYVMTRKVPDVEFCDRAEKYLEENPDKALYVFFSW